MAQRKRYLKPFKEEALRLAGQEGVSLTQVSKDLGLDDRLLRRWRKISSLPSKGSRSIGITFRHEKRHKLSF